MGNQDGCLPPEGKEVQALGSVGQAATEMAKVSGKAEMPKVFVHLATAVASATEAYQEELFSGSGLGEFGVTMLKSFLMSQKWIYS